MNRLTVALLAALDAVIVVAIGLGVALVPLTVMWAVQFHLEVDWTVFWRASADAWLLGHGVDLTITLPKAIATAFGATGGALSFPVTIAALGIALFAVLMGVRTGIRAAGTPFRITGAVASIATYGILGIIVAVGAGSPVARPNPWQGIVLPAVVFAIGVLIGLGIGIARERAAENAPGAAGTRAHAGTPGHTGLAGHAGPLEHSRGTAAGPAGPLGRLAPVTRATLAAALRGGAAATAAVIGASAVLVAILFAVDYARIVGLYESLQGGVLGAVMLTVAQLALLPNAVIWAASWLVGPGFVLGTGSSLSPAGTTVGPVPALPLLGILPQGSATFAFVGLLVPVLAGFAAGALTRRRIARTIASSGRLAVVAVGIGCVTGIVLGLLAWFSAGAIGPGRLVDAGPNGWAVGLAAAAEVAVGALIGIFSARRSPS